jgi:small-conductance mechanosensitive channel
VANLGIPWLPDWAIISILLAVGLVLAFVAHRVVYSLLCRFIGLAYTPFEQFLARTKWLTQFIFIILALELVLSVAPLPADFAGPVRSVLAASIVVIIGWGVFIAVNIMEDRYIHRFARADIADFSGRKAITQVRILRRVADVLILVLTAGFALMTFDSVRQFGISLFASAGIAGIALGLAARPVLGNIISGVQLALTQPVRLGDLLVFEGQSGTVEEIGSTNIILKTADWRRLVVPLNYFLEKPIENWTHMSSTIMGTVTFYLDYTAPIDQIRGRIREIADASKFWNKDVLNVQVTDTKELSFVLRVRISAASPSDSWELCCEIREKMIAYFQTELPGALVPYRSDLHLDSSSRGGFRNRSPNSDALKGNGAVQR